MSPAVNPTSIDKAEYQRRSIAMNNPMRKRIIDGITAISNPIIVVAVVALLLFGGWLAMDEITPLLWVIAGAYFLLALIGGQCARGLDAKPRD